MPDSFHGHDILDLVAAGSWTWATLRHDIGERCGKFGLVEERSVLNPASICRD